MALLGHQTVLVQRNSQGNSAAVSADGQSSSESKQHPDAPASPEQQPFKREAHGSSSPKERQLEPDELSRCTTPPRLVSGGAYGVESLMQAAWAVPFPDSSVLGRSPRGGCAADSSHSDGSNTSLRNYGLTESPPWSPRRVPPAHCWGEGPPRAPGYRSGGARYPVTSPGVSAAHLVEAACELHALMQRRAACGLGPLIRVQPFFPPPAPAAAAAAAADASFPGGTPAVAPAAAAAAPPAFCEPEVCAAEELRTESAAQGSERTVTATPPPPCTAAAAATGLERPAAWCACDSHPSFGGHSDADLADEVSSPQPPREGAPPVPDLHESACAPELADAADSARPPVAGTCSGGAELGSLGGPASLNRLRRPPSTPDLMGISPCLPDRVLPTGHGSMNRQPAAASQDEPAPASGCFQDIGVASAEAPRRRTKRRLF